MFMFDLGYSMIMLGSAHFYYFFGSVGNCSWVCVLGGYAEDFGRPFVLFDKVCKAGNIESISSMEFWCWRFVMTTSAIANYYFQVFSFLGMTTNQLHSCFMDLQLGSAVCRSGSTGFYPLWGPKFWCRFGCTACCIFGISCSDSV